MLPHIVRGAFVGSRRASASGFGDVTTLTWKRNDKASFCIYILPYKNDYTYDRVVSIAMMEAVGVHYFDDYFRTIKRLLKPKGYALVHYSRIMRGNSGKEILKLTVTGSNVSGSTKYTSPPAIGMVIDTKISGQVSSNGDITANFTSTNHYRNGTTAPGPPGKMNGKIIGQVASGSVTFDRKELSQPPATGTWRAVRQ